MDCARRECIVESFDEANGLTATERADMRRTVKSLLDAAGRNRPPLACSQRRDAATCRRPLRTMGSDQYARRATDGSVLLVKLSDGESLSMR